MLEVKKLEASALRSIIKHVKINTSTGCWEWEGSTNNGYGEIRVNKQLYRTHRFVYALLIGPIPKGKGKNIPVIDHLCRNRRCCNPAHLQLISDKENILLGKGATAEKARQTHCRNGHELPEPVRGHRRCLICLRKWQRENYKSKKNKSIAQTT